MQALLSGGRRSVLLVAVAVALVVGACGGDADDTTTTSLPAGSTTAVPTTEPPATQPTTTTSTTTTSTTTTSTTTTTLAITSTTQRPTTTAGLPGEPIDLGWPRSGDVLAVVGVVHDDVLNVRSVPGVGGSILATLAPTDTVVAGGNARILASSIWYDVTISGRTGWANSAFLAYVGATDDATSEVVALLGGIPSDPTMLELGRRVARALASTDPPSRVTMTVEPAVGDLGEVTYDVIGLGDDAVFGFRLHVFGQPGAGGDFSLKSVERTILCGRGVSDGLCV